MSIFTDSSTAPPKNTLPNRRAAPGPQAGEPLRRFIGESVALGFVPSATATVRADERSGAAGGGRGAVRGGPRTAGGGCGRGIDFDFLEFII